MPAGGKIQSPPALYTRFSVEQNPWIQRRRRLPEDPPLVQKPRFQTPILQAEVGRSLLVDLFLYRVDRGEVSLRFLHRIML